MPLARIPPIIESFVFCIMELHNIHKPFHPCLWFGSVIAAQPLLKILFIFYFFLVIYVSGKDG